jgi:hypothetical protein
MAAGDPRRPAPRSGMAAKGVSAGGGNDGNVAGVFGNRGRGGGDRGGGGRVEVRGRLPGAGPGGPWGGRSGIGRGWRGRGCRRCHGAARGGPASRCSRRLAPRLAPRLSGRLAGRPGGRRRAASGSVARPRSSTRRSPTPFRLRLTVAQAKRCSPSVRSRAASKRGRVWMMIRSPGRSVCGAPAIYPGPGTAPRVSLVPQPQMRKACWPGTSKAICRFPKRDVAGSS